MAKPQTGGRRINILPGSARQRLYSDPEDMGEPRQERGQAVRALRGGDPTRRMTQAEYDKERARQKARAEKKYLRWKTGQ
jgi:hypothetical protein